MAVRLFIEMGKWKRAALGLGGGDNLILSRLQMLKCLGH